MRRIPLFFGCLLTALALPAAYGADQAPSSASAPPDLIAEPLSGQQADSPPRGAAANRWRYSFHNGHWWYYQDGGRWSFWTGKQWADYESDSYRRWYVNQRLADYDARLARFDARWMRPYMSESFIDGYSGFATFNYRGPMPAPGLTSPMPGTSPWAGSGGMISGPFAPRGFDGRLNPATSLGGYMGGALRGPFGY